MQLAIESRRMKFDNSKLQKAMKIDQHPFPTNMLDAKGKTKVLTLELAEKKASVDPQHRLTTDDAKGKGLIKEGSSSGRPPHSGVVITHGIGRLGSSVRIGISNKRKGSEKNGIGIKITRISHSSFIVGNKITNYQLSQTVLSAMFIISMIGQTETRDSRTTIDVSMGRLGGECQFMIGWG